MALPKTKTLSVKPAKVVVKLQAGTDRTVYATWQWSRSDTECYDVKWYYYTSDGKRFEGQTDEVTSRTALYNAPSNAVRVGCVVRAKGPFLTYKENGKTQKSQRREWITNWTGIVTYPFSKNPPQEAGAPDTVTIDGNVLKVELNIDPYEKNVKKVEFHVYQDGKYLKKSPQLDIKNKFVSWSTPVETNGHKYKVRVFTYNASGDSAVGDYSGDVGTIPGDVPSITDVKVLSETSVRVIWNAVTGADSYQIEYATDESYFDASGEVSSATSTTNYAIITGLESGKQWFFRVRAVNTQGESGWTKVFSRILGVKPSAPTTWSSTTTVIVGEPLILYWAHNAEDSSSQESAILELTIDGVTTTTTIVNDRPEEDKDKTSTYEIDTSSYREGVQIKWRVKTKGIVPDYSDWSVLRTVDVYAKPSMDLAVTDNDGVGIDMLTAFPINIKAVTYPKTQKPVGYHLTVIANESYETVDSIGNVKIVSKDSEVYRGFFDISTDLEYVLSAGNIDLENNISYTVKCIAAMNSGLTAEATHSFTVGWGDYEGYEPEVELTLNEGDYSMTILPYCVRYPMRYWKLKYLRGMYILTDEELSEMTGEIVEGKETKEGDQVYKGTDDQGNEVYFTMMPDSEGILIEGVTLSVYRREFDGRFVELGTDIPNNKASFITDPHPALDYARYRVVATDIATGSVVYSDVAGYEIDCPYVIIQWDETWGGFDVDDSEPTFNGSMLKIKGNIDVSDKHNKDVSLVEYIGREHPVSYNGTQLGVTSTWNMEFDKQDEDTLYALRRLAIWMGDVYVREPSGSGYWASISVAYSQNHCELTIPVTFDITRVEGGV